MNSNSVQTSHPSLAGRVVLVTGAGRGIGLATVRLLVQAGARVVAVDLPGTDWAEVQALAAPELIMLEGDVGAAPDWERSIAATLHRFGRLDALVNNAGISGRVGPLVDCDDAMFDEVMRVNARGVFLGLKHGARAMLENAAPAGGAIVNISSVSGLGGGRFTIAYTASKHAVVGMTKLAAAELAPSGIRVNAVCPAPTSTEMVFSLERTQSPADPELVRRGLTKMIPMGRYGEPEEIAAVVLFLISDASSFMTGAAVPVDGGVKAA
jgi:3alpha(or 20beta)-hydroxysteroid dehydrogenase